jgi:hypothetical protein
MRFVDTNDQRSSSYMLRSSWHKWWQVLFWDALVGAMTLNAQSLYNATRNKGDSGMEQREFREQLVRGLLTAADGTVFTSRKQEPQRPRPLSPLPIAPRPRAVPTPPAMAHMVYRRESRGRCVRSGCEMRPTTGCRACQRALCIDCFEQHHADML